MSYDDAYKKQRNKWRNEIEEKTYPTFVCFPSHLESSAPIRNVFICKFDSNDLFGWLNVCTFKFVWRVVLNRICNAWEKFFTIHDRTMIEGENKKSRAGTSTCVIRSVMINNNNELATLFKILAQILSNEYILCFVAGEWTTDQNTYTTIQKQQQQQKKDNRRKRVMNSIARSSTFGQLTKCSHVAWL